MEKAFRGKSLLPLCVKCSLRPLSGIVGMIQLLGRIMYLCFYVSFGHFSRPNFQMIWARRHTSMFFIPTTYPFLNYYYTLAIAGRFSFCHAISLSNFLSDSSPDQTDFANPPHPRLSSFHFGPRVPFCDLSSWAWKAVY